MNILNNFWSTDTPPKLMGSMDLVTKEILFPPLATNSPLIEKYVLKDLDTLGTLYTYTIIFPNPKSGLSPFSLGYLDLINPKVRIFGRILQDNKPNIGDRYQIIPNIDFGYVFEPVKIFK